MENIMGSGNPKISVEYTEKATIAVLTDEKILAEDDIQALENSLIPLVSQNPGINLIIDFSNVRFFSSAVLGLLIRVSKRINESDGRLKLCSIDSKIYEIFKITRLDTIFDICDDQQKAIRSLEY
jgi:anti-sigma B factor antagonist